RLATVSAKTRANSGPRWLIIGRLIAATTRGGTGVGPGMRRLVLPRAESGCAIVGPPVVQERSEAINTPRGLACQAGPRAELRVPSGTCPPLPFVSPSLLGKGAGG